jgi:ribosomal protein S18 acetylase RimI-like enzyme
MSSAGAVALHDRGEIELLLRHNEHLHLYSIGDLDDFFWPYTMWFSLPCRRNRHDRPVALLYFGDAPPTLLALDDDPDTLGDLLVAIRELLPPRFYAHLTPGAEQALAGTHRLEFQGSHLKMALVQPEAARMQESDGALELDPAEVEEVSRFYARSYPGNWFDPRMLETGRYYGIRLGGELVSVAGIHVYSRRYGVAALGNIATLPAYRNQGLGKRVVARLCQALLEEVSTIGLNVKADNLPAIASYRALGFETVASYGEYVVERAEH